MTTGANIELFYPDRFVGARFFDQETRRQQYIALRQLPDEGYYAAAADARTLSKKRRKDRTTDDDNDDDNDEDANSDNENAGGESAGATEARKVALGAGSGAASKKLQKLQKIELNSKRARYSARDVEKIRQSVRAKILHSPPMQSGVDANYQHSTREIPWSCREVLMVEYIARRVPLIAASISTIKTHVLREGLKFTRDNIELVPSHDFEQYVLQRLVPFAYQVLDAVLLLGVVPILYEMDAETGQRWPYVPAIGTYIIKKHTVHGATRLRFYWSSETAYNTAWQKQVIKVRDADGAVVWRARQTCDPCGIGGSVDVTGGIYDPTVEIIHNIGYDLMSNCGLGSKVASLLQMADARSRLQRARTVAESNAAMPPIITEYNYASEKQASAPFVKGYYTSASAPVDMLTATDSIADRTYERDTAQREAFAGVLRAYEDISGRDASSAFGVNRNEYRTDIGGTAVLQDAYAPDGTPLPWQRQYHLSSNRVLKNGPTAHVSTDYVSVLAHMDNEVCSVMGVPLTYIQGTSVRTGADLISSRLNDEVSALKKLCSDIMTHVYNALFLGDDIRQYMNSPQRRERFARETRPTAYRSRAKSAMTNPLITETDLFVADAIGSVTVGFMKNPAERLEELQFLYALGAIDQSVLAAEIARRSNFDPTELFVEDDEDTTDIPLEMRQMSYPPFADYIKMMHAERMQKQQLKAAADTQDKRLSAAENTQKLQITAAEEQQKMQIQADLKKTKTVGK